MNVWNVIEAIVMVILPFIFYYVGYKSGKAVKLWDDGDIFIDDEGGSYFSLASEETLNKDYVTLFVHKIKVTDKIPQNKHSV